LAIFNFEEERSHYATETKIGIIVKKTCRYAEQTSPNEKAKAWCLTSVLLLNNT